VLTSPLFCALDPQILSKQSPEIYDQLMNVHHTLEQHYRDMQDIEFTVQVRLFLERLAVSRNLGLYGAA
jgi:phosphoenolpyruvate synthase/pyruvate phosphate dikinase